jgi:hypothetical protein
MTMAAAAAASRGTLWAPAPQRQGNASLHVHGRGARGLVGRRPTAAAAGSVEAPTDDLPADAPTIVVVGLGPGDPKQLTLEAFDALTAPGAQVHVR